MSWLLPYLAVLLAGLNAGAGALLGNAGHDGLATSDPLAVAARTLVLLFAAGAWALDGKRAGAIALGLVGALGAVSATDGLPMILAWSLIGGAVLLAAPGRSGLPMLGPWLLALGLAWLGAWAGSLNLAELGRGLAVVTSGGPVVAGAGAWLVVGGVLATVAVAPGAGGLGWRAWAGAALPLVALVTFARLLPDALGLSAATWWPLLAVVALAGMLGGSLRQWHAREEVAWGRGAWEAGAGMLLLGLVATSHPELRAEGLAATLVAAVAQGLAWFAWQARSGPWGQRLALVGLAALPGTALLWGRLALLHALVAHATVAYQLVTLSLALGAALAWAGAAYTVLRSGAPRVQAPPGAGRLAVFLVAVGASLALFVMPDPLWQLVFKAVASL